ncbi:MAG: PepSY-associated TM helix domain-containing protein [Spongiibacteraceae bacterium]
MFARFWPSRWYLGRWSLGTVRQWHWISSAICLIGMLLFALTGVTLNHAATIPASISTEEIEAELPVPLLQALEIPTAAQSRLPKALRHWLDTNLSLYIPASVRGEWSEDELYVALPGPGEDAWMSLDLQTGELIYERTSRGWIAYLNDLHKGRDTGVVWSWFIDVFAIACAVFCLSGLLLLYRHSRQRPSTWPMVGLGLVIPLVLIILFVH